MEVAKCVLLVKVIFYTKPQGILQVKLCVGWNALYLHTYKCNFCLCNTPIHLIASWLLKFRNANADNIMDIFHMVFLQLKEGWSVYICSLHGSNKKCTQVLVRIPHHKRRPMCGLIKKYPTKGQESKLTNPWCYSPNPFQSSPLQKPHTCSSSPSIVQSTYGTDSLE